MNFCPVNFCPARFGKIGGSVLELFRDLHLNGYLGWQWDVVRCKKVQSERNQTGEGMPGSWSLKLLPTIVPFWV